MSSFHPTTTRLHPPPDQNPRAAALVAALGRHLGYRMTWSLPVILVVALATAGLAPLVILLLRFRNFATGERFQLEHVSEWMKPDGEPLPDAGERPRSAVVKLLVNLGFALAAISLCVAIAHVVAGRNPLDLWTSFPFMRTSLTGAAYPVSLGLGFVLLLAAIYCHRSSVRRFAADLSVSLAREDRESVSMGGDDGGTLTRWSICGVVLMLLGCGWGLPMMLAAGAHRRYINEVSRVVRAQLADRIEQVMAARGTGYQPVSQK